MMIEKAWHAVLSSGSDILYYIEAKRTYSKPSNFTDLRCDGVSAFRGWVWVNRSGEALVAGQRLEITDCDMKSAGFTNPMGLIEINGVNHAIVQMNGWESQEYGILKIERTSVSPFVVTAIR